MAFGLRLGILVPGILPFLGFLNSFFFVFRFGWEFEFPFKLVESVGVGGL